MNGYGQQTHHTCPTPANEWREVKWRDGVIVEFEAYEMHMNEGGSETWSNELSVFQRGIVLGDMVVGCDYELCETDFKDGVYLDGVNEDGSYHVDEYMRATLVEPSWLQNLLDQHSTHLVERIEKLSIMGKIDFAMYQAIHNNYDVDDRERVARQIEKEIRDQAIDIIKDNK
jgi:hypothetical protein